MSDDLIKRLLAEETDLTDCAADRIEQTEAKLAKAMETLRFYASIYKSPFGNRARATLAELEGGE